MTLATLEPRGYNGQASRADNQAHDALQTARTIDIIQGLSPALDKQEKLRITVRTDRGAEARKILGDKSGVTIARAYVMSLYENRHSDVLFERNLRAAISRVTNELFTQLEAGEDDFELEAPRLGALIKEIEDATSGEDGWIAQAIDASARYARVAQGDRRGMWRIQGNKTARFCSAPVYVLRGRRPGAGSRLARVSTTVLRFDIMRGEVVEPLTIEVSDDQYTSNELANKLMGYASYPETDIQRRQFAEMIKELGRTEGALYQDELETYGMVKRPDGSYFFALLNGCETAKDGFLEGESAPALAPSLPVPENGYVGKRLAAPFSPPESLDDDFYHLLLNRYAPAPAVEALNCALLGLGAMVQIPEQMLPPGISAEKGYLKPSPDLVGPSRHGKSRILNAHLSRFGTGFRWSSAPLLKAPEAGKPDTAVGRNHLQSAMKNMLYVDYDHKASPDNNDFEKHRGERRGTINNYADGPTGGVRGKRSGGVENRGAPSGFCVRTCNTDYAPYEIDDDMGMIEARACSFLWPIGIKGDNDVSIKMDEKHVREQAYAIEQGYRRWLMGKVENSPEEFKEMLADSRETAYTMAVEAIEYPGKWPSDIHRNHLELMIMGCLIYMDYLGECLPGYHLSKWIENHMGVLMADRAARSLAIAEMEAHKQEEKRIDQVVIEAIKWHFTQGLLYVRGQRGGMLNRADVDGAPFRLDQVGYSPRTDSEDNEFFNPGRKCICYWINKGQNFAFEPENIYEELKTYAASHKNIKLPSLTAILKALYDRGLLVAEIDKGTDKVTHYKPYARIDGKRDRYIVIPVSAFFSAQLAQGGEINPEDEEEPGELPANIREFPAPAVAAAPAPAARELPLDDASDDAFEEIPLGS